MTYLMSEEALWERKRNNYIMMALMPIAMTLFAILTTSVKNNQVDYGFVFKIIIPISAFIIAEMLIVTHVMIKKIKCLSIVMDETGFSRVNKKNSERYDFANIESVTAVYNPSKTRLMQLKCKGKKCNIILAGFDNMEELKEHFIKAEVQIKEKNMKADWNSPLMIVVVFVGTLAVMSLIMMLKGSFYDIFSQLFQIGFGLYLIGFKIISKTSGAKFRKFELILGGLLTVLGSISLVFELLAKF